MKYSELGKLRVSTFTASGALPILGSTIKITGTDENNKLIQYSLITDEDGTTKSIELPAPPRELSEAPYAKEVPYAVYDVEITKDGYYTKKINNVAVFSGTEALLNVNMIPFIPYAEGGRFPKGNIDATVEENPMLE